MSIGAGVLRIVWSTLISAGVLTQVRKSKLWCDGERLSLAATGRGRCEARLQTLSAVKLVDELTLRELLGVACCVGFCNHYGTLLDMWMGWV